MTWKGARAVDSTAEVRGPRRGALPALEDLLVATLDPEENMKGRTGRRTAAEIDDRQAAAFLAARAFIEIRHLARRESEEPLPAEDLKRIWFLADLCHNMPGVARPRAWRPSRRNAPMRTRDRVRAERPMSWTWNTTGAEGRAWILERLGEAGHRWTPPPPLPTARTGPPRLTLRQRIGVPGRWPVRPPTGCSPLPRPARVLKVVDADTICALYEEAGRLRLGLGSGNPWLRAHLDSDAVHYLVPDPAAYYWPDEERRWWQCTALLRMSDGEQVTGMIAVLPETFTALPSTLSRRRQRRLLHLTRATERDTYLWGRDHETQCGPEHCGYTNHSGPPDE